MRLIDADKLLSKLNKAYDEADTKYHETDFDSFYGGSCSMIKEAIKEVDTQPTAYDVNKVVEDVKQIKFEHFLTIANTNNEALDVAYEKVGNAIDKAVKIVKSGGMVSDMENLDVRR